jgi:hypothetical protein
MSDHDNSALFATATRLIATLVNEQLLAGSVLKETTGSQHNVKLLPCASLQSSSSVPYLLITVRLDALPNECITQSPDIDATCSDLRLTCLDPNDIVRRLSISAMLTGCSDGAYMCFTDCNRAD